MVELFREDGPTREAAVYGFENGATSVGLVEHVGSAQEPFDPAVIGLDHLAFSAADRDDLHAWAEHLDRHGIMHAGPIEVPPGEILNFKDPDGVAPSLFWDRRAERLAKNAFRGDERRAAPVAATRSAAH